jgi:hypothetical protein
MIVALVALFVALGGGAYGALRIKSRDIANNTVRSKDVRNSNCSAGTCATEASAPSTSSSTR